MSFIVHSVLETPAAIAGDIFTALLIRTKLYQTVWSEAIWQWFSNFFEWAFVKRANLFMCILSDKFERST
jgi:hypothetical protein